MADLLLLSEAQMCHRISAGKTICNRFMCWSRLGVFNNIFAELRRKGGKPSREAIRPITVREGDKVSEIPAMQALIRTMFRAAAQGDTKAARQLLEVISRAESGRTGTTLEILKFGLNTKKNTVQFSKNTNARALILRISILTRTTSSSMKLPVRSQLTGRLLKNRPARAKVFGTTRLNQCGGISS
jgi:hypothetical protein